MGGSDRESCSGGRTSSLSESALTETLRFKSQPLVSLVRRDFARVSSFVKWEPRYRLIVELKIYPRGAVTPSLQSARRICAHQGDHLSFKERIIKKEPHGGRI